ncbi:S-adenosyl-L-methionine-dependent methyltransferase [Cladochytrium replicatum]|nr:S-adenosyl-L-methionine-dependent methyltransferase [Cladochytrium replicatum]
MAPVALPQENDLSQFKSSLKAPAAEVDRFLDRLAAKNADSAAAKKLAEEYDRYWRDRDHLVDNEDEVNERVGMSAALTNAYYDLSSDFYEYGWGESFHFARMHKNSSFQQNLARHESLLAVKLGLGKGMTCLDVGCGVGGPLREIARLSNAFLTGLNNNAYQVGRARKLNQRHKLDQLCKVVKGSFNEMPFPDGSFDRAYAIEATCHAARLEDPYGEAFRVLKPGGLFACYEWCTTEKYDETDVKQKAIIHGIEEGDGIAKLRSTRECLAALKKAGFEIVEYADLADPDNTTFGVQEPWYQPLKGEYTLDVSRLWTMRMTPAGRAITHVMVNVLETVGLAPPGTVSVSSKLLKAATCLVEGGEKHLFTPMFFFLARKPYPAASSA